jgi:hypothetical protein
MAGNQGGLRTRKKRKEKKRKEKEGAYGSANKAL